MTFTAGWVTLYAPSRLTESTLRHDSGFMRMNERSSVMPALLSRMCRPPSSAATSSTTL